MTPRPIADAHVHLWDLDRNPYPWLREAEPTGPFGKTARIRHSYRLADYLQDAQGQEVRRFAHIEAGWDPADPVAETRWLQGLAEAQGAPHAIIGHADLAAAGLGSILDAHARASPLFVGVRDRLQQEIHQGGGAPDAAWLAAMARRARASERARPELRPAIAARPDAAGRRAGRCHPRLRFVLTHAGYPPRRDDPARDLWRDGMRRLADCPNVVVKLSGFVPPSAASTRMASRPRSGRSSRASARDASWSPSNFPVDRLFASLDALFSAYREALGLSSLADQDRMLHDNACEVYKMG